jgi:hypothetical protein
MGSTVYGAPFTTAAAVLNYPAISLWEPRSSAPSHTPDLHRPIAPRGGPWPSRQPIS